MKAALGGLGMVSRPMAAITGICHRNLRLFADRMPQTVPPDRSHPLYASWIPDLPALAMGKEPIDLAPAATGR